MFLDRTYLLNCGGREEVQLNGRTYVPDQDYIHCGDVSTIDDKPDLYPTLTSVRFFPDNSSNRFCFKFPVTRGKRYIIRTTYYYGNFDGKGHPPVFDQFIDTTRWTVVDTVESYRQGVASFYEIVAAARAELLHVCVARNNETGLDCSPFINALEVQPVDDILYNGTNWGKHALATVARSDFGTNAITR